MGSLGIVKCHPILDDASGVEAVSDFFEIDRFMLRQRRSMKMLSRYRPRPSIEIRTAASVSVVIQADLVNWLPWTPF